MIELFIPTPTDSFEFQKLVSREFSGNATVVKVAKDPQYGASYIYARWENVKEPALKITNVVELKDRFGVQPAREDIKLYLEPTDHVPLDGIVKETALKITKGNKDHDQQARLIYDWIVDSTVRDPKTRGCGVGDVKSMLKAGHLGGKCADINSLFVALARASGIPAREVFGQRVMTSQNFKSLGKEGEVSKTQHCRAEYYSQKKGGWFPVDPADIRKAILEENLTLNDPKIKALREKFFGFWEGNWVAYNWARDFQLLPKSETGIEKTNFFMYPLLLTKEMSPDGVDPDQTGYRFISSAKN